MHKVIHGVIILTMLLVAGNSWPKQEQKVDSSIQLAVDLTDGSHIIGASNIKTVSVRTQYANIDIALEKIAAIKFNDDHETASFELQNGDKLSGIVKLAPVELETIFGKVKIGAEHITHLAVSVAGTLPATLNHGLILHYTFDKKEGTKIADKSGQGHDGRIKGVNSQDNDGPVCSGVLPVVNGLMTGAFRCDGVNDVILAGDLGYQPQGTLSFWMKADAIENWRNAFSTDYANGDRCLRFEEAADGTFGVGLGPSLGGRPYTNGLQLGKWYHVAFAWTTNQFTGWIDGQQAFSEQHNNQLFLNFNNVAIGNGYSLDPHRHWKGLIGGVRIYNRVLKSDEVRLLKGRCQ